MYDLFMNRGGCHEQKNCMNVAAEQTCKSLQDTAPHPGTTREVHHASSFASTACSLPAEILLNRQPAFWDRPRRRLQRLCSIVRTAGWSLRAGRAGALQEDRRLCNGTVRHHARRRISKVCSSIRAKVLAHVLVQREINGRPTTLATLGRAVLTVQHFALTNGQDCGNGIRIGQLELIHIRRRHWLLHGVC